MEPIVFRGVGTAIVTPFNRDKSVDFGAFGALIDEQIAAKIAAVIVCGTTGEAATLDKEEKEKLIDFAVKRAAGKIKVIAGTGSNSTLVAVQATRAASALGVDAVLCVTPFYNKATQEGLVESFFAVADASEVPVIIYEVPSRTGVTVEPETYAKLSRHENIVAVKEASGNVAKIAKTMSLVGDALDFYSGSDELTLPVLALGGAGVISVASNVVPERMKKLCDKFFAGDVRSAKEIQLELIPLISSLFSEVNPIPVKAALSMQGKIDNVLRLPLTPMSQNAQKRLAAEMRRLKIIE